MKNEAPVLTVNVITYNHRPYIEKCLDSILAQKTNFNFLIRIFDDCSTDGSTEICQKYAEKYPDKITLYTTNKNLGLIDGPIRAYRNIQTPYYIVIESDDYLCSTEQFQKEFELLEKNKECSFCAASTITYVTKEKKSLGHFPELKSGIYSKEFAISSPYLILNTHISTRMVRTKCITLDDKNPEMYLNDVLQMYELLRKGPMIYVNEEWCVYNYTEAGIWSKNDAFGRTEYLLTRLQEYNKYTNGMFEPSLLAIFITHANCNVAYDMEKYKKEQHVNTSKGNTMKAKMKAIKHYFISPFFLDVFNMPRDIGRAIRKKVKRNKGE